MNALTFECFVCHADADRAAERPWDWSSPRVLCATHDRVVRLAGGSFLEDALARVSPEIGPLEGSRLGHIYNPVQVQIEALPPVRAWADFTAGGMALLEDRCSALSYFEFWALTNSRALDALYGLRLAAMAPNRPEPVTGGLEANIAFLYAAFQQVSPIGAEFVTRMNDGWLALMVLWNSEARLQELRACAGRLWPESHGELEDWLAACAPLMEPDARPVSGKSFVPTLLALSERRFGALAPWPSGD